MSDAHIRHTLDAAWDGVAPGREQCVELLRYPAASPEAAMTRAVADSVSRRRFAGQAMLLGQIGIATDECPGGCGFCVFGQGHALFDVTALDRAELLQRSKAFADSGQLYALFLMTMHDFDREALLDDVAAVRAAIPAQTRLVANIGDCEREYWRDLREAGLSGAYHVLRLREGTDTSLDPAARKSTIAALRDEGLDWYYCCEPIGPEHTPEELVEQMFFGLDHECFQHAAMRRVCQPNLPLAVHGQISELRLAQVVAVVTLAMQASPSLRSIAVHEPNVLGLCSGANTVYAETGANPRDTAADTAGHRGLDVNGAAAMVAEVGWTELMQGA